MLDPAEMHMKHRMPNGCIISVPKDRDLLPYPATHSCCRASSEPGHLYSAAPGQQELVSRGLAHGGRILGSVLGAGEQQKGILW